MDPASPSTTSRTPVPARAELTAIDDSCRGPVLLFLVAGALWLLVSTGLAIISAVQLHNPGFLGDLAWLTYGRARPATTNAFTFGWAFNAAFAVTLWLMARLSDAPLRGAPLAVVGGIFWNLGVLLGVGGILIGDSTGQPGLEIPGYATPVLLAAYALIGVVGVAAFRFGRSSWVYVSQWYLLAALFWFPWLYSVAQVMLVFGAARGVVQAIGSAWFSYNVYGLWLAPVALAAIYYLLPKLLGRPIRDYGIARMGFWCWGLFASWAGVAKLVGGPVPAWVQAAGTAACLMLLVPIVVIAINHLGTLAGQLRRLQGSPTLTFTTCAVIGFVLAGACTALGALRSVAETVQFTYAMQAVSQLELYACFSLAAFGAIYFLLPRLVRREWPSAALVSAHLWSSVAGVGLSVLCLLLAGWLQGQAINDPEAYPNYVDVVARTIPYLVGHSLATVLLAIGHIAFAVNLGLMLLQPRAAAAAAPDLFRPAPALEVVR